MAIGFKDPQRRAPGEALPMQEINTTPLIDVMLVLIIMLIITIPAQLHQLSLGAAQPQSAAPAAAPAVKLDVRADGSVLWNGEALADARALQERLSQVALAPQQPQVLLRPDLKTPYREVAAVMAMAQRVGVTRLGLSAHPI